MGVARLEPKTQTASQNPYKHYVLYFSFVFVARFGTSFGYSLSVSSHDISPLILLIYSFELLLQNNITNEKKIICTCCSRSSFCFQR